MTRSRAPEGVDVEYAASFGRAVRELRQLEGLTQEAFAFKTGIDHAMVSRYESGKAAPTRLMVERIIDRLPLARWEANRLRLAAGFAPRAIELDAVAD